MWLVESRRCLQVVGTVEVFGWSWLEEDVMGSSVEVGRSSLAVVMGCGRWGRDLAEGCLVGVGRSSGRR